MMSLLLLASNVPKLDVNALYFCLTKKRIHFCERAKLRSRTLLTYFTWNFSFFSCSNFFYLCSRGLVLLGLSSDRVKSRGLLLLGSQVKVTRHVRHRSVPARSVVKRCSDKPSTLLRTESACLVMSVIEVLRFHFLLDLDLESPKGWKWYSASRARIITPL